MSRCKHAKKHRIQITEGGFSANWLVCGKCGRFLLWSSILGKFLTSTRDKTMVISTVFAIRDKYTHE